MEGLTGRIIRGIGGFYYVKTEDGQEFSCKARGIFRKDGTKPMVGDYCRIVEVAESDPDPDALPVGNVLEILPRKNELLRPAVANVDQVLVVFALSDPEPNFSLIDTFLLRMELSDIPAVLLCNKTDLDEGGQMENRVRDRFEKTEYPLYFVSVKELAAGEKTKDSQMILSLLQGKCTALAGPSGVGKSSLINLLQNRVKMETGSISKKTARGKHTTRHSELIEVDDVTFVLDTPGFTALGSEDLKREQIREGFPEIRKWEEGCRFAGCSHISEPDCMVKEKLSEGLIGQERYDSYVRMYQLSKNR